jgi:hypothetical protein
MDQSMVKNKSFGLNDSIDMSEQVQSFVIDHMKQ